MFFSFTVYLEMADGTELCDMKSETYAYGHNVHETDIKSEPGRNTVDDVGSEIKSSADEHTINKGLNINSGIEDGQSINGFEPKSGSEEYGQESIEIKFE